MHKLRPHTITVFDKSYRYEIIARLKQQRTTLQKDINTHNYKLSLREQSKIKELIHQYKILIELLEKQKDGHMSTFA